MGSSILGCVFALWTALAQPAFAASPLSQSTGLTATITKNPSGYSALENPSQITAPGTLNLSYGWVLLNPAFNSISNIVLENNTVSDKDRSGSISNDYRVTLGQLMGLRYNLFPDLMNLSVGVTSFLPWSAISYFDTGETFAPEYVLDRSRTQRAEAAGGLAFEPLPKWNVGFSLRLAYNLTARANVFLQTNPAKPSALRFLSSLRAVPVPILGTSYTFSGGICPGCMISGVVRFPAESSATLDLTAATRVFGDTAALAFQFAGLSTLYFDPWSFDLGFSVPHLDRGVLRLEASYQRWSTFKPPTLMISNPSTSTCENGTYCPLSISPSQNLPIDFRDIIVFGANEEWLLKETGSSQWFVRAGVGYRPGVVKTSPNTTGNYNMLDPGRMLYSVGGTLKKTSWSFDVFLAYHQLETQTVTKSGSTDIGAPGYSAGGSIFGGGGTVSLEI